jgi:hypothetical protein
MLRAHSRPLAAALIACLALATSGRSETVYLVSQSTGKLLRFDSADTGATTTVTTLLDDLVGPSALTLGPDGGLYIAEWGDGDTIDPRVSRYDIGTAARTVVATLDPDTQFQPSAIAFRPAAVGGQMLVGRTGTLGATGTGAIYQISGWDGGAPVVASTPYNTGIALDGSSGLAVAADGTTYVSNSKYVGTQPTGVFAGSVVKLDAGGVSQGEVVPDGLGSGGLSGPAGLILAGDTLFIGSVTNSSVYRTTLDPLQTSLFGAVGGSAFFDVGPIARLADGSILGGSVSGFSNTIYRFLPDGSLAAENYFNPDFGRIGGLAIAPVPEPGGWLLAVAGITGLGWAARRRSRSGGRAS